jgi:hypothetical protein
MIYGAGLALLVVLTLVTLPVYPSHSTTVYYVLQGHPCSSGTIGPQCVSSVSFQTQHGADLSIQWSTKPSSVAMSIFSVFGPNGQLLTVAADTGFVDFTSTGGTYSISPSTVAPANVTIEVVVVEPASTLI